MSRVDKTRDYLKKQLELFMSYENQGDSKEEFFESIRVFRKSTIPRLKKTRIIKQEDLDDIDGSLAKIDSHKSAGYGRKVYWDGVRPHYDHVQSKLKEFILSTDDIKLRLDLKLIDFLCENWVKITVGIIIIVAGAAILYLLGIR